MKKLLKRILKVFLIGLVALIAIFALGIYLLGRGMCDTFDVAKYKSPSGHKTLVRSTFGCGATTKDTTSIILKGLKDKTVISIDGAQSDKLDARWVDENNVIINYSGNTDLIYEKSTNVSGITFKYKNGANDLNIKCLYAECEKIDREKALIQRKEWCDYSKENRDYCDSPERKGWETCEDGSWCHFDDGGCDSSPEAIKRCADASAEANRPLVTAE